MGFEKKNGSENTQISTLCSLLSSGIFLNGRWVNKILNQETVFLKLFFYFYFLAGKTTWEIYQLMWKYMDKPWYMWLGK